MSLGAYRVSVCAAAALLGCQTAQPTTESAASASSVMALRQGGPGRSGRCAGDTSRQFDFWLGRWEVTTPAGQVAGVNRVERELDGCLVEENWTSSEGIRGRSLNYYDPADQRWHQMWVAAPGGVGAVLLLDGGFDGSAMVLAGPRVFPNGFRINDEITWTEVSRDQVRQVFRTAFGGGPLQTTFDGLYTRTPGIQPAPETVLPVCGARDQSHQFDFLLGVWTVRRADSHSSSRPGREGDHDAQISRITTDLSRCLIEETETGRDHYRRLSFSAFSIVSEQWHRTYVDNQGRALRLRGGADGDSMVLVGETADRKGPVQVRVRWTPEGPEKIEQRWASSRDGGATWETDAVFAMRRRAADQHE